MMGVMARRGSGRRSIVGIWLRVVVLSLLVAGVLALAAERWFYLVPLYSLLIGLIGGLCAHTVVEGHSAELLGSRPMVVAGAAASLVIFVLVQYLRYRLAVIDLAVRPGWWEHLVDSARGITLSRLGREGFGVGPILAWGYRALDLGFALSSGGYVAMKIDLPAKESTASRRR